MCPALTPCNRLTQSHAKRTMPFMKKQQVPNLLTVIRIIAIPLCVMLYYLPVKWAHYAAAGLFALASITDFLDGYLARHWQGTSRFGAFLDPVADKLMVAVILVVLVGTQELQYLALPASVIVGREIIVSALREWMAEIGKRGQVAVSWVGKVKTSAQMASLFLLLLHTHGMPSWIAILGAMLLYVAAGLTLWSMVLYLRAAWPELRA